MSAITAYDAALLLARDNGLAGTSGHAAQAQLALAGATTLSRLGCLATLVVPAGSGPSRIESAVADEGQVRIEVDATGASFDVDAEGAV